MSTGNWVEVSIEGQVLKRKKETCHECQAPFVWGLKGAKQKLNLDGTPHECTAPATPTPSAPSATYEPPSWRPYVEKNEALAKLNAINVERLQERQVFILENLKRFADYETQIAALVQQLADLELRLHEIEVCAK